MIETTLIVDEKLEFLKDVIDGFSASPKWLNAKYFYDARGARLFDEICRQPEYYLTVTEISILKDNLDRIAALIGEGAVIIELGSGSSKKTRILLRGLENPHAYLPVDISPVYLSKSTSMLEQAYPDLDIIPINADFTGDYEIPDAVSDVQDTVVFFPGSTIGNFNRDMAQELLRNTADICGAGSGMLIGVDLKKDDNILNAAYNDAAGVTAEFNLNIIRRISRELYSDIDPENFLHKAFYNRIRGRIEMHLESVCDQQVEIQSEKFDFKQGETIHTENSYKYTIGGFKAVAEKAGYQLIEYWTDEKDYFSLQYYECVS